MGTTDHGELLTKFDEIFGNVVEHEVIKMVLQNCDWNSSSANEMILNMIDPDMLPPRENCAVTPRSNSPGEIGGRYRSRSPDLIGSSRPDYEQDDIQSESEDTLIPVGLDLQSRSQNESPTGSIGQMSSYSERAAHECWPTLRSNYSRNSTLTPFAMAQGGMALSDKSTQKNSLQGVKNANSSSSRDETAVRFGSESPSDRESDVSIANSPYKPSAPLPDSENESLLGMASWVLAPEFIPKALHPLSPSASQPCVAPSLNRLGYKDIKKNEIISKIQGGMKIVVLMRGLPGCGKSTLAKEIKGSFGVILSTDDFFIDGKGRYMYNPSKIPEAHSWNKYRAQKMLQEMKSPIIIDNTNLKAWEMKPYVLLALQNGYEIDILEPETSWKFDVKILSKKNSHGVPKEKIREMLEGYEKHVKIEDIIASLSDVKLNDDCQKSSRVKKEKSPNKVTNWPESLPGNVDLTNKLTNGINNTSIALGGENISGEMLLEEAKEHENSNTYELTQGKTESSLSRLRKYRNDTSNVDDADVVIESCEEIGNNIGGIANSSSRICNKAQNVPNEQVCLEMNDKDSKHELAKGNGVDVSRIVNDISITGPADVDNAHQSVMTKRPLAGAIENDALQDEDKIRMLIEEANLDTDEHTDSWDDLVKDSFEEDLNEDQFNDLVRELGTSVRNELDKKPQGLCMGDENNVNSDKGEFVEDSAMYEFCTNMEDRLGRSLSSVITTLSENDDPSNSFSVINASNLVADTNDKSVKNYELAVASELQTTGTLEVINDQDENVITNFNDETYYSDSAESLDDINEANQNEESSENKNESLIEEDLDQLGLRISAEEHSLVPVDTKSIIEDTKEVITVDSSNLIQKFDPTRTDVSAGQSCSSIDLTSWDCMDMKAGESITSWEQRKERVSESDLKLPKPTRDRKRPSGDPQKWMASDQEDSSASDQNSCLWEPVSEGAVASWNDTNSSSGTNDFKKLQCHTGAVPKVRKQEIKKIVSVGSPRSRDSPSPRLGDSQMFASPIVVEKSFTNINRSTSDDIVPVKQTAESETQTLSIDFQALEMDNNLYELKILYGQPDYIPVDFSEAMPLDNGPLTRGKLSLDKGTMTENSNDIAVAKPLRNLIAFFPNIREPELKDVLEKCKYDLDWAMNVLLDSGYEMADSVDVCSQESSEEFDDVLNTVEPTNTNNNGSETLMDAEAKEDNFGVPLEEKNRRLRQSQTKENIASKREIENAFMFPESVDDRVTRLTGKSFEELNVHKVKQKKTKKKHSKKKHSETNRESVNWEEGEGAQFITLVMDPLFASQLMSMFGPIGSCGMSGDMAPEDRNVILPLELCHQIHKYWTKTLDGKFKHETEVLDSLIREDENLARRLQKEEDELASENVNYDSSETLDSADRVFQVDPPKNLREIMDLEQALRESQNDKVNGNGTSLSSQLTLQRLYAEYTHVDPEAVKQVFTDSGFNYQEATKRIKNRYGSEPGVPKTVMAPEYIQQYEEQQALKAKELSMSQLEPEEEEFLHVEEEIHPEDPQMYRDEAQMHYNQRQEYYNKAQEAYRNGMKNVAVYFARLGKLHSDRLNEANKRASLKIIEAVNLKNKKDANVLDLHLLHVPEAVDATKAFLQEREQLLTTTNINQMQVSLITGRGAHSVGGQAKLKPAIRDYLQKKGYKFHEGNIGMFVVTLHR